MSITQDRLPPARDSFVGIADGINPTHSPHPTSPAERAMET